MKDVSCPVTLTLRLMSLWSADRAKIAWSRSTENYCMHTCTCDLLSAHIMTRNDMYFGWHRINCHTTHRYVDSLTVYIISILSNIWQYSFTLPADNRFVLLCDNWKCFKYSYALLYIYVMLYMYVPVLCVYVYVWVCECVYANV
jgi:hypothetical protein